MRKIKFFGVFLFIFSSLLFLNSCGNTNKESKNNDSKEVTPSSEATESSEESQSVDLKNFKLSDDGKTIESLTDYGKRQSSILIPNTVESIGESAFNYCVNLISVVIPDSVTSIGKCAFSDCENLKSITISDNVTTIGNSAFAGCKSLIDITIPDSVTSIGNYAFGGCDNLVYNEYDNAYYLGNIENPYVCLVKSSSENIGSCNIYTKTKVIYDSAFNNCQNLTSIIIPDDVTSIGDFAFRYCYNLTNLSIGENVESIGEDAFSGSKFKNVIIGKSVNYIGKDAFDNVKNVYYKGTIEDWNNIDYNWSRVSFYDGLYLCDNFYILDENGNIEYNGENYSKPKEIIIPDNVTAIKSDKFKNWDCVISCIISDNVTSIGEESFYGCGNLKNIIIGKNVKSISYQAFYECNNLTNVYYNGTIEDWMNIKILGYLSNPMYFASNFYILDENGDVEYNGSKYSKLNELFISNNFGRYNFSDFNNVTDIIISSNVTDIQQYAFNRCNSLTNIVIPNTITFIGDDAFYACSNLTNVYYNGTIEDWCNISFKDYISNPMYYASNFYILDENGDVEYNGDKYSKIEEIVIPSNVTKINNYIFYGFNNLRNVTIPNTVTSIGKYAFTGCVNLTSITIPNTVTSIGTSAFTECYKLVEIINKSSLNITKGSDAYGYIAKYAKQVISDESETKLSTDSNGFITYNDGTDIWLVNYIGSDTEITIPSNVTKINDYAFWNKISSFKNGPTIEVYLRPNKLISVIIGNNVISIGRNAFYSSCDLVSITIGSNVTSIGDQAFMNCYKLVEIINKSSLNIKQGSSDYGYIALYAKQVISDVSESKLSIDSNGFITYNDGTDIWLVNYIGTDTEISIPNNVTKINEYAFYNCINLTSVTIPNSVTSIGSYAFASSCNLISVIVGNGVLSIGQSAFYNCVSLKNITIPGNVKYTGNRIFDYCSNLMFSEYNDAYYLGDLENPYLYLVKACYTNIENCVINDNTKNIFASAFSGCTVLTNIVIPDNVTSIGKSAFSSCSNLKNVTMGNSVTSIGESAFYGCTSLTSITIPNSVTSIGESAFYNCSLLENLYYNGTIENWCNIAFSNYLSTPIYYAKNFYILDKNGTIEYNDSNYSELTEIIIPNTITKINNYQFYRFKNLRSVTIPNTVTSIVDNAFNCCFNLTNITIPNSVTSIGSDAFEYCYKLVEVINKSSLNIKKGSSDYGYVAYYAKQVISDVSESKLSIDSNGFITYNDETDIWLVNYIGNDNEIVIPSKVTKINYYAFYQCNTLTDVIIHDSATTIGNYAFYECNSLTGVTMGNNVTSIGSYAFSSCSNLKSVTIGNSVTSIGSYAFYQCNALTNVIISNSVTSIKERAFKDCENLMNVTIGNSVTSIGYAAFEYCYDLTTLYYNGTIEDWCNISFKDSTSNPMNYANNFYILDKNGNIEYNDSNYLELTEILIPNSITIIKDYQFYGISNLCTVTIPNTITSIGSKAFTGCNRLVEVINKSSLSLELGSTSNGYVAYYAKQVISNESESKLSIDTNGFITYNDGTDIWLVKYIGNDTEITIPSQVTKIYDYAFLNYSNLVSVTIPASVTSIEKDAFKGCYKLVEVKNKSSLSLKIGSTSNGFIAYYAKQIISDESESKLSSDSNGFITYNDGTDIWLVNYIGNDTEITIPSNVTKINNYAFYNCNILTNVTLLNTVTSIGDAAFSNCRSLTNVIIQDSVIYIEQDTFDKCISLTNIVIPNTVTYIRYEAFANCSNLTKVYYKGTSPYTDTITSIGSYNTKLINATWYYFTSNGSSETKSGWWWYYDTDGETIIEKVIK